MEYKLWWNGISKVDPPPPPPSSLQSCPPSSLHLRLICSQGEILYSLQDRGGKKERKKKKRPGNHSAKPTVGRLRLGVVQHLLLYFPVELTARFFFLVTLFIYFLPKWFFCTMWDWLIFHNNRISLDFLQRSCILSPVYKSDKTHPGVVSVWQRSERIKWNVFFKQTWRTAGSGLVLDWDRQFLPCCGSKVKFSIKAIKRVES